MLTPEQLRDIPEEIVQIYIDLEDEIISDIARRISKAGVITETAEYQIDILKESGMAEDEINKKIEKILKEVNKVFDKTYDDSVNLSISQDALIYEQTGKDISNLLTSSKMIEIIEAQKRKTLGDLSNLTKTLGFIDSSKNSRDFKDINKFLYDTLNYTQFQIASGAFSPDYVIKQAVRKLADSGLRTIDYNSGRSNALDVAVRRATLTGIKQTTGVIGLMWADELDCDIMEITAHSGARPDHAVWQGQLVSRSGQRGYLSLSDIGYGDVTGFKGANCIHDWNPFFPGISSRNYTDEQLKNIDPEPFEYEGRVYNSYQANQRQRQMETSLRQTKRRIIAYDGAGAKDMMTAESVKLRLQRNEYEKFSKVANLRVKSERHQVLGYNRSISSKSVWAEKKEARKYDNYHYSKNGIIQATDDKTHITNFKVKTKANPYTVLDTMTSRGFVNRTIYNEQGKMIKQINTSNHGNPKKHPYGIHGEHIHDIIWDEDKIIGRTSRELTEKERKENQDIL